MEHPQVTTVIEYAPGQFVNVMASNNPKQAFYLGAAIYADHLLQVAQNQESAVYAVPLTNKRKTIDMLSLYDGIAKPLPSDKSFGRVKLVPPANYQPEIPIQIERLEKEISQATIKYLKRVPQSLFIAIGLADFK